jgi:hypothetical protein
MRPEPEPYWTKASTRHGQQQQCNDDGLRDRHRDKSQAPSPRLRTGRLADRPNVPAPPGQGALRPIHADARTIPHGHTAAWRPLEASSKPLSWSRGEADEKDLARRSGAVSWPVR